MGGEGPGGNLWRAASAGCRSHFQDIGNNGIQIQNANATDWVLEGIIVTGNVFRDVNVGVILENARRIRNEAT